MSICTHLIKSVSVDKVLAERQEAINAFTSAMAMMKEAQRKIALITETCSSTALKECFYSAISVAEDAEECGNVIAREMDVKIWTRLMDESGMYSIMSHKQRNEWEKVLYGDNMPLATMENIASTFSGLYRDRDTVYHEGITHVFRSLSWDYKTNNPVMIGKKIIKDDFFEVNAYYYNTNRHFLEMLDDLARAFYLFDKKPLPDHRSGVAQQLEDFFSANGFSGGAFEHEYFSIKYFMKGTAHITFKRPDVVDAINDLIAEMHPGALPAPR
ncbi:DUF4942 domain-containing protein [Erwinia amylovora]|uniref:DUF4942 domain-containing protein n=1 Tax=Erwinia amylovora TaxID=552 RepID=UPI0020BF5CBA|nr:DUF4942 domain-containing protein [Erwinia amylovora]MCK8417644.1 DUF4942 domain-containing protein [Erwinia amylovora]